MRILFVAMSESVHTARWVSQLYGLGWDIHLFPSRVVSNVNPELRHVTLHHTVYSSTYGTDSSVKHRGIRLWSPIEPERASAILQRMVNKFFPNYRLNSLCRLIEKLQPDIVHTLELQYGGYFTLEARKRLGDQFPTWIISSWGNDIYLYRKIQEHREKLKEMLAVVDYYISDCKRDIPLARELGLKGEILGSFPGGGGYHLDQIPKLETLPPPSARKIVLLKGYQHFTGRALFGLRALALCADILQDFEVIIYFPSPDIEIAADVVAFETGLSIRIFQNTTHAEWIRLLSSARVNIGVSISDGTPLSMLESLLVGTFPIQSYTACVDEWVTDGETGLIVPPEAPLVIAEAVRRAILDDELVDSAARINARVAAEHLGYETIRDKVVHLYEYVYASRVK